MTFLLEANYPKGRTNLGRYQVPRRRIWIHFTNPCLLKFPAYVYVLLYQLQLILINSSFLTEKLIYTAFSIVISKTFCVYKISSLNFPWYCRNSLFSSTAYDCLWWLFKMIIPQYHPSLYHSDIISWGAFCKVSFAVCSWTFKYAPQPPSSQGVKRNLRIFFFKWNSSLSCRELVYPNWLIVVWS